MMDVSNTHSRTHLHTRKTISKLEKKKKNAHDGTRQDCPMSLKKNFVFVVSFQFLSWAVSKLLTAFPTKTGREKTHSIGSKMLFFFRHEENAHEILKFSIIIKA
jgi:hypothetical protein